MVLVKTKKTPLRNQFLFVGMDIHKDNHTAVATDCFGQNLLSLEIADHDRDFRKLSRLVDALGKRKGLKPVFGLEDSYGYGQRLADYLAKEKLPIKMVAPVLVDHQRQKETHPEKSDSRDALGTAKVLIQRIDTLPTYSITRTDKIAKEIRELVLDRRFLVKEQTRLKNHLHRLLHRAFGTLYQEKFKNPFCLKALKCWRRYPVARDSSTILKNQIRRKTKRLLDIRQETKEIENELALLIDQTGQKLHTLNGCGTVLTAQVLSEIRNIKRFNSPHALAKYAGTCPREKSSGKTRKHIKTKSGNRRLNMAFHRIALSQISLTGNGIAKKYFHRKVSEGKTKQQALCCLKRRLVNIIFMMLKHKQEYRYPR